MKTLLRLSIFPMALWRAARAMAMLCALTFLLFAIGGKAIAAPSLALGTYPFPAPQWQEGAPGQVLRLSCRMQDGRTLSLPMADKSGPRLIHLWASWCLPCLYELPRLGRLQAMLNQQHQAYGFLAVSVDADPGRMESALALIGAAVPPVCRVIDPRDIPPFFGTVLPQTILVGPSGDILARQMGPAAWDSPETMNEILRRLSGSPQDE